MKAEDYIEIVKVGGFDQACISAGTGTIICQSNNQNTMRVEQCNRNPFSLADFAYDGKFSDGEKFSLRIPEEDVVEFANTLLKAYRDDKTGKTRVAPVYVAQ